LRLRWDDDAHNQKTTSPDFLITSISREFGETLSTFFAGNNASKSP